MDGAFELCYKSKDDFCVDSPDISYFEIVSSWFSSQLDTLSNWFTSSSETNLTDHSDHCLDFELKDLTLGQVVSASSAAAGGASVQPWVESIFELLRQHAKDALRGGTGNVWYCSHYRMLIENFVTTCNHDIVVDEFLRVLGCETSDGTKESANSAAKRWSSALERMAIRMTAKNPFGDVHSGYMAIDAVRPAPHTCLHRTFQ